MLKNIASVWMSIDEHNVPLVAGAEFKLLMPEGEKAGYSAPVAIGFPTKY